MNVRVPAPSTGGPPALLHAAAAGAAPDRHASLAALMRTSVPQNGTLSRSQVLAHGFTDEWISHRLRTQRWQRVHPGVYATFTGPLPWLTRCHAALHYYGAGASLAGPTATALELRQEPSAQWPVVVAVDHRRRVMAPAGTEMWRVTDLAVHVQPARDPARLRFEVAALLTASRARTRDGAIGVIADACQSRRTTAARLFAALSRLPANLRFRRVLHEILDDVATGAYSYLEVQYLRRVERPHGLPTGRRQRVVRPGRRIWLRDVEYVGLGVVAEIDGRLGHETYHDRALDIDRDNVAAREHKHTVRAGYPHVMSTPCPTAQVVGEMLRSGGWRGHPRHCGPACVVE